MLDSPPNTGCISSMILCAEVTQNVIIIVHYIKQYILIMQITSVIVNVCKTGIFLYLCILQRR